MSPQTLEDKVCVVSGPADAAGRGVAARIADEGGVVISAGDFDVASEAGWIALFAAVGREFGRLDGLVNIAAVGPIDDTLEGWRPEHWQRAKEGNLTGPVLGSKHGIRLMQELSPSGSIVNVGPAPSSLDPGGLIRATTMGGLRMLTQSTAVYCNSRAQGIRCNAVRPGRIDADGLPPGAPAVVAFLLSDEAGFITGAEFTADGRFGPI